MKSLAIASVLIFLILFGSVAFAGQISSAWKREWPRTDFGKFAVEFSEIVSGGPPRDAIPAIDYPLFTSVASATDIAERYRDLSLHTVIQDANN